MPTVYRSTDTDAPVLTGITGSLIAVLDACLVNGYGDKSAAGWTKAFSGTNQAAYRNDHTAGASGAYFLIEDDAPGGTSGGDSRLTAYGTMTAIDAGTNDTDPQWFRKGAATGDSRPWIVVADELTAWIYCFDNGDTASVFRNCSFAGFGDWSCVDADNAFRYFILGSEGSGAGGNNEFVRDRDPTTMCSIRHPNGVSGKTNLIARRGFHGSSISANGNCGSNAPAVNPITGAFDFENPPLTVSGLQVFMGRLRGVKRPGNRLDDTQTAGSLIGDSSLIFTAVNADGNSGLLTRIGALVVDSEGPW